MPYTHTTALGTTYGNLTDDERLRASQGMNQAQIAAQMAALQAEINDRQVGRQFDAGQAAEDRTFKGGMFDKDAAMKMALDRSNTERQLGVTGLTMAPANAEAALNAKKWDAGAPERTAYANVFHDLGVDTGDGAPAAPLSPADRETKFQHTVMTLAALKGGAMPDFGGQAITRQAQQLALDEAKRRTAMDQATEARNAGDTDKAKKIADAAGVSLARVSPDSVATSRPMIVDGINQIANLAKSKRIDEINPYFRKVIKDFTDNGVDINDAVAYIRQKLDPVMAKAGTNWGDVYDNTVGLGFAHVGEAQRNKDPRRLARQQIGLPE